jgi:hypothetical protein
MGYCSASDVKAVLQETSSTYDAEVASCIVSGDGLVDSLLKVESLTVPSVVPQNIKDADAYFAAWMFRRRRDPTGAEAFWSEGQRFLNVYIDSVKLSYVGSV